MIIFSLMPIWRYLKLKDFLNDNYWNYQQYLSFEVLGFLKKFWVTLVVLAIDRNRRQTIILFYSSRKLNLVSGVCYTVTIWLGILNLVSYPAKYYGINAFRHLSLNFLCWNTRPDLLEESLSKVAMGAGIIYLDFSQQSKFMFVVFNGMVPSHPLFNGKQKKPVMEWNWNCDDFWKGYFL